MDLIFYKFMDANKTSFSYFLVSYHEYLGKCIIKLKKRTNTKTAKFYRYINEDPTVLLILIIFIVIIKPL